MKRCIVVNNRLFEGGVRSGAALNRVNTVVEKIIVNTNRIDGLETHY